MKHLPSLALILALASCATPPPKAILPPASEVRALDVAPVSKAATATREAVREVVKAGTETRKATDSLRDQIDRTADIAAPYPDLGEPFAELKRRAELLAARVAFAEQKEDIAIQTVDELTAEAASLREFAAEQKAHIINAHKAESTLRNQVESLSESADKRVIAEDKLKWWRKAAWITWGVLTVFLVAKFFGAAILAYARARI